MESFHHALERLAFSSEKMKKTNLVDTANLFCNVYGLEAGQSQAGHRHAVGDKLYYVLAGNGRIRVDADERDVAPGDSCALPPAAIMSTTPARAASRSSS